LAKHILLLEDEQLLGETIKELLETGGYRVDHALDGDTAAELSYEKRYDLYIFDINVPLLNGFELLEGLRNASDRTPAIFISAMVDLQSITKGFSLGAEDYIKKPFFPEELLVRVDAKLKGSKERYECGALVYDYDTKELTIDGRHIALGEVQQQLFSLFVNNPNTVIDKADLLDCLESPSSAALRVAINKLKQTTKLPIENVRGVGYVLEAC